MWTFVPITLVSGVGSNKLYIPKTQILLKFAVPTQTGITSGTTDIVITEFAGVGDTTVGTILTITDIVTPYSEIPKKLGVGATNVVDTALGYQAVSGGLKIAITGGSGSVNVGVWVLLTDDDAND